MLSDVDYNKNLLSRAEGRALDADPSTDRGFIELRIALMELLSVDAYSFKQRGTSKKQKRLLPEVEELFCHQGIVLCQRNDVDLSPNHRIDVGRADSGHLLREISYAMIDGGHYWDCFNGEQVLHVRRLFYVGTRESLTNRVKEYLEKRNAFVDGCHIATVDVSFTAPALKWFVLKICESYRSCV